MNTFQAARMGFDWLKDAEAYDAGAGEGQGVSRTYIPHVDGMPDFNLEELRRISAATLVIAGDSDEYLSGRIH